jgi:hypothetical protein
MSATAADFQIAIAHYRMQFPTLASLGDGTIPGDWKAEYDRVASEGLSATLITELTYEGGGHRGIQNFDQKILIRALMARRAELDSTFHDTAFSPARILPSRTMSVRVWA